MKRPLRFLSGCLLSAAALLIAMPAEAAGTDSDFRISAIRQMSSFDLILVGKDWRKDLPTRLLVSLRTNTDIPSKGVAIKAYFYNKDNKLVYTAGKPSTIWTKTPTGISEVSVPKEFKKGKPVDVYFALPEAALQGKWKSVVVVFGVNPDLVARSLPQKALEEVDFPEKQHIDLKPTFSAFDN